MWHVDAAEGAFFSLVGAGRGTRGSGEDYFIFLELYLRYVGEMREME
jgi:hypothetical protein